MGESDGRESTPRRADEERAYMETSVRRQGDRLLRDMLQLRRDIEMDLNKEGPKTKEEHQGTVLNHLSDLESTPGLEVGKAEENMLRERLEMMTQQIKQEMAEELQKEKLKHRKSVSVPSTTESTLNNSDVVINGNSDVNPATSTVDKTQMNGNGEIVAEEPPKNGHTDVKNSDDSKSLLATNGHFEAVTEITKKEEESEDRLCPGLDIDSGKTEDEICSDTKSKSKEEATTESLNNGQHIITDESAPQDNVLENQSVEEKKLTKSRTPSVKVDTLKRKKKLKKVNEKPTIVEIPFCSHSQHLTGQDQTTFIECVEPKKAARKAKPQLHTVLSPADRLGAEQILHELIEIRDGKTQKEKDPVLDTMISVIQLSSTNLSLPAPSVGGGGVQFKELFDFEVNFSESREAFAKLSGDGKHTVQELFPWTTGSGDTRQDAAVGCNKEDVFKKLRAGIQPR